MNNIYTGILAAFFSSILVSFSLNLLSPGNPDVSSLIFVYTLPVYLILGIPLSILIHRVLPVQKWWHTLFYYTLIGSGLCGFVLFTSSLQKEEELVVSAYIIGCTWVYSIILMIISNVRKMGVKT
ncbi:hypothetical protein [Halobacillus trueperi]|uniref:hypothetical protein n=1 Tax=Halobacillus trueperi TaxID=156205 RepID=UPI003736891A